MPLGRALPELLVASGVGQHHVRKIILEHPFYKYGCSFLCYHVICRKEPVQAPARCRNAGGRPIDGDGVPRPPVPRLQDPLQLSEPEEGSAMETFI